MAQPGHARPGDRSRREDDRYLFLEALVSARDALHISWVGRNVRDNSPLPPSVLVGQLRDYLAAGWREAPEVADTGGDRLLDALTIEHPLQPFSRRYFNAEADTRLFTYASEWRQAHRSEDAPTTTAPLPEWQPDAAIGIGQLQGFLSRPVRYFFNQRLKVHFGELDEEAPDDEPFGLNALEHHLAVASVLRASIVADDAPDAIDEATRQLVDQGALPPGGFGALLQESLRRESDVLATEWRLASQRWPLLPDKFELQYAAHGVRVEDWLTDLRRGDETPYVRLELVIGKLLQKNGDIRFERLLAPWVIHLLAHAHGLGMQTRVIGQDAQLVLRSLDPNEATTWLDALLATLREGMRAPLPLARKTAFAWLLGGDEETARKQALMAYDGTGFHLARGEAEEDPYLARAWPSFDALEAGGFTQWLAIYQPLLDVATREEGA
jgi:exodeoxyribonuclease V gamma subunit